MFKIHMTQTVKLLSTWPLITFHKGITYWASHATNQPDWETKGLVFAEKRNGESMLLEAWDYTTL